VQCCPSQWQNGSRHWPLSLMVEHGGGVGPSR
jgi:hypothetical protein